MVKSSSIQQSGNKLYNSLIDTHSKIVRPVKSFVLKSSMEFASRSLSIFNKLNTLEMNHETWVSENETHESFDLNNNVSPPVASDAFKKPFAAVARKRKGGFLPYQKNMKKWIKYSLEDTPISSDTTNTAVALQFLDDLRKKNEVNEVTCSDDRVVFCKPNKRCVEMGSPGVSSSLSDIEVENHSQYGKNSANRMELSDSNVQLHHLQDNFDDNFSGCEMEVNL